MNLPVFYELQPNQGTYITFSKPLLDLDYARNQGKEFYYTKMVALNLPNYKEGEFYADVTSVGVVDKSPNMTVPKMLQYYLENLVRQTNLEEVTELGFWKMLRKMGLTYKQINDSVVFINTIATESFTLVDNNAGWCEIVCSIPNTSKNLEFKWKQSQIPDKVIVTEGNTDGIFDTDKKEFLFTETGSKNIIDFSSIKYTDGDVKDFDFNILLMFYKDRYGVEKLHGINFLNDFTNKVSHWEIPRYTKITNDYKSIGYQFKINMKTVNNEANKVLVEQQNFDCAHWNTYLKTLSQLNSIILHQERQQKINNSKY